MTTKPTAGNAKGRGLLLFIAILVVIILMAHGTSHPSVGGGACNGSSYQDSQQCASAVGSVINSQP